MMYWELLTVTTLISPASHISWINSDSNVIAARSLSAALDIFKKGKKEVLYFRLPYKGNRKSEKKVLHGKRMRLRYCDEYQNNTKFENFTMWMHICAK